MCFPDIYNVLSSSDYACLHADKLNVSFPGGGGGGHSQYILVGVCRGTSKRGVLGTGTTPKGGGGVLGTGTTRKKVGRRFFFLKKDDYSDRLKKRGLTLRRGSGSKGGGVLGTGQARKRGVLGTGQVKKGGSLPRHIPVLDIYVSASTPRGGGGGVLRNNIACGLYFS